MLTRFCAPIREPDGGAGAAAPCGEPAGVRAWMYFLHDEGLLHSVAQEGRGGGGGGGGGSPEVAPLGDWRRFYAGQAA